MDHVHVDDTKESNQVTEAADDSLLNTSVNESLQLFKPKILIPLKLEIKRKKVPILMQYMITSWKLRLQTQTKP